MVRSATFLRPPVALARALLLLRAGVTEFHLSLHLLERRKRRAVNVLPALSVARLAEECAYDAALPI
jgi:hypothetical protein